MSKTIKILSIDGGGIRGIIPALILAEIEQRTGKPICKLFDLIAGTSTGGILALGLTKPDDTGQPAYRAEDLVRLYKTEGPVIFSRSVWHRIRAVGCIFEEKYPAHGIEGVLERYFGSARLKDALTEVLVPSYEIERRMPFFFKSKHAKEKPDYDFSMKTVARATSAAPTYFEPVQIIADDGLDYYALIDGGVFANNPALCAYAEAVRMFPEAEDFLVVSLGTGELTRPLPYEEVKGWGLLQWAQPILNVVFDGVSDTIHYQLQQLLPDSNGQKRYYRFQTRLDEGNDDLDDISNINLRALQLLAETLIHGQNGEIDRLCERLTG